MCAWCHRLDDNSGASSIKPAVAAVVLGGGVGGGGTRGVWYEDVRWRAVETHVFYYSAHTYTVHFDFPGPLPLSLSLLKVYCIRICVMPSFPPLSK